MKTYSLSKVYSEARCGNGINFNHESCKAHVNAVPIDFFGKVVLDVACGHENPFFSERLREAKYVIGLDGNGEEVQKNSMIHERHVGDIHAMPLADNSVDMVVSVDTIEHSVEPDLFLKECHRVLRSGGQAVFATPNLLGYKNAFAKVSGKRLFDFVWRVFHSRQLDYDTCYRCNTARAFNRKAQQAGLRVVEIRYVPEISWFLAKFPLAFTIAHAYNRAVVAIGLENLLGYMVVKVVKM
jgi:SAM-dependent methyltransferase